MFDNSSVDVKDCHDNGSHQQKHFLLVIGHCHDNLSHQIIGRKDYNSREGCQAGYLIYFTRDIYVLK